ncbi:MAG: hypothetical protein LBH67_01900 [Rickettsia sp.]|jgi:hypothetical protein|nr:hypothetical protein [Rickettsia sp.]
MAKSNDNNQGKLGNVDIKFKGKLFIGSDVEFTSGSVGVESDSVLTISSPVIGSEETKDIIDKAALYLKNNIGSDDKFHQELGQEFDTLELYIKLINGPAVDQKTIDAEFDLYLKDKLSIGSNVEFDPKSLALELYSKLVIAKSSEPPIVDPKTIAIEGNISITADTNSIIQKLKLKVVGELQLIITGCVNLLGVTVEAKELVIKSLTGDATLSLGGCHFDFEKYVNDNVTITGDILI